MKKIQIFKENLTLQSICFMRKLIDIGGSMAKRDNSQKNKEQQKKQDFSHTSFITGFKDTPISCKENG